MEISFKPHAQREFWRGVNSESVGEYIRNLEKTKKRLEEIGYDSARIFNGEGDYINDLKSLIDTELEYCRFYFEYKKRTKETDFDQWVYIENYKRKDWSHPTNTWVRDNGKIKVLIELKPNKVSTKVSLCIENASSHIEFVDKPEELSYTNLRSQKSIDLQIEEYKTWGETVFKEKQYPRYCKEKGSIDEINALLHIQ